MRHIARIAQKPLTLELSILALGLLTHAVLMYTGAPTLL